MKERNKRQNLPPGALWVVATPIGNLADFTDRGRLILETVDVILCEDTRRTQPFLSALGISGARLERLDAHATETQLHYWIERLQAGDRLAFVSDAGTPAVSDPGAELVRLAHAAGLTVSPIPGASAVTALLSVAGMSEVSFTFRGFFPRKAGERTAELQAVATSEVSRVFIWFESPQRIRESLAVFATDYPAIRLVVAKELTKLHERIFSGSAVDVVEKVLAELDREGELGEWVMLASFPIVQKTSLNDEDDSSKNMHWQDVLTLLLEAQVAAPTAAKRVSQYFGISRQLVYQAAVAWHEKKETKKD